MSRVRISPPRPLFISGDFRPNFPRADELHAQTRREVSPIAHPLRRPHSHGGRIGGGGYALGLARVFRGRATGAGGAIFSAGVQGFADRIGGSDARGFLRGREVGACGKAAAPSGWVGFLERLFQRGGHPCALRLPPSVTPHPALGARSSHGGGRGVAAAARKCTTPAAGKCTTSEAG